MSFGYHCLCKVSGAFRKFISYKCLYHPNVAAVSSSLYATSFMFSRPAGDGVRGERLWYDLVINRTHVMLGGGESAFCEGAVQNKKNLILLWKIKWAALGYSSLRWTSERTRQVACPVLPFSCASLFKSQVKIYSMSLGCTQTHSHINTHTLREFKQCRFLWPLWPYKEPSEGFVESMYRDHFS